MNIVGEAAAGSDLVFLYTCTPLTEIANLSSHGIQCADVAGIPEEVVNRAFEVLRVEQSSGQEELSPIVSNNIYQMEKVQQVLSKLGDFDCHLVRSQYAWQ